MNLGDKLVEIRKKNKMSQEKFAEELGVTRQTVSNWENYKNYPDINTLIKISDRFKISLDILLKEDKKMIDNISKCQKDSKKYKKIVIVFGIIGGIFLLAVGIYFAMYYNAKYKLEHQFEETIKANDFYKNEDGYYTLDYSPLISYDVPNQKVPIRSGYNFHFFAQHVKARIKLNDNEHLKITWIDYNYYDADLIDAKTGDIIISVGLLGKESINQIAEITKKVDIDEILLKEAIDKGNDLYKQFYE